MSWTGLIVGMAALALLTGGPATWRAFRRAWSGRRLARTRWLAGVVLVAVASLAVGTASWLGAWILWALDCAVAVVWRAGGGRP